MESKTILCQLFKEQRIPAPRRCATFLSYNIRDPSVLQVTLRPCQTIGSERKSKLKTMSNLVQAIGEGLLFDQVELECGKNEVADRKNGSC